MYIYGFFSIIIPNKNIHNVHNKLLITLPDWTIQIAKKNTKMPLRKMKIIFTTLRKCQVKQIKL